MTRDEWLAAAPQGWQELVRELDTKLAARWPDYTIDQVKEKFGTLRFYANPGLTPPEFPDNEDGDHARDTWRTTHLTPFYALIAEYEDKSSTICEACGKPGKVGDRNYWYSTRCPDCAPQGWVAEDVICDHPTITEDTCTTCGREHVARLEHSEETLQGVHPDGTCIGETCTIHHRSNHSMRAYRQQWRGDRGIMERICPHGVGHPDPDEYKLHGPDADRYATHGCDGCCTSEPPNRDSAAGAPRQ